MNYRRASPPLTCALLLCIQTAQSSHDFLQRIKTAKRRENASTNEKAAFPQMSGAFARNEYWGEKITESVPLRCRAILVKIYSLSSKLPGKKMQSDISSERKPEHLSD